MDKETLSNYGWIVICVLVLAVMIALATPFGNFIADAVKSTTQGLFDTNQNALNAVGIAIDDKTFAETGNDNDNTENGTPVLNEYGFYYNQPYTANVVALGGTTALLFSEDGTLDVIGIPSCDVNQCTYTCSGNQMTIVSPVLGTLAATISDDGTEIYCNELQISFVLGDESIAADEDYIYLYDGSLGGYVVNAFDKTKTEYGPIKTGINGLPTVKLADSMFEANDNLKRIPSIPNSVKIIGNDAFNGCLGLTSVTIPEGVTSIGSYAFCACANISNVVLPNSVANIGPYAFYDCVGMTSVTIGSGVTSFGIFAFGGCTNLTSITIAEGVTHIGDRTFEGSIQLTSVTIPDSVVSIGFNAFAACGKLNYIAFEGTTEQWNEIEKGEGWNKNVPATEVICSDGTVSLS